MQISLIGESGRVTTWKGARACELAAGQNYSFASKQFKKKKTTYNNSFGPLKWHLIYIVIIISLSLPLSLCAASDHTPLALVALTTILIQNSSSYFKTKTSNFIQSHLCNTNSVAMKRFKPHQNIYEFCDLKHIWCLIKTNLSVCTHFSANF